MTDHRFSALKVPSSLSIFFSTFWTISDVSIERKLSNGPLSWFVIPFNGFQILNSFASVLTFEDLDEYNFKL